MTDYLYTLRLKLMHTFIGAALALEGLFNK